MKPAALRLRLLLTSAASILFTVVLVGLALAALFSDHVERQIRADLQAQMNRLIALVDPDSSTPRLTQDMPDPRFALPYGGLYWQIRDSVSGELARSRSLWDHALAYEDPLPSSGLSSVDLVLRGPEGGEVLASLRQLDFEREDGSSRGLEVIVAESRASLDAANAGFRSDIFRALALLVVALLVSSWVQVTLGLSPLSVIQRGINAIRTGGTRKLEGEFPLEVMPLVTEVNELLRTQETSISFARARADDLAHGLKTALTVLNAEAETVRKSGNPSSADAVEKLAAEMAETIDHQLRLSRLRHRSRSDRYATSLAASLRNVVNTLRKTPKGERLDWTINLPNALRVDLAGPDLTELIGVVTENACKWAEQSVVVTGREDKGKVLLIIEDDGPGIPPEQKATLGERGKRLDQTKSGSGIGLSIAREIVALNGGTLGFDKSGLGGLCVTIGLRIADAPHLLPSTA